MANRQKTKPKTPETGQKAQAEKKNKRPKGKLRPPKEGDEQGFPVVGIGASAGGVKALEMFFSKVPADCRMAFVVVQHLNPHHESRMVSIISRNETLEVTEIEDGTVAAPSHVYIKPPGKSVIIKNGILHLQTEPDDKPTPVSIDTFFSSLAEDQREKAFAVILSGAGSDGTLGAGDVKENGGMVMVQETAEADYPQMPNSAIHAGVADFILPVEKMPARLLELTDGSSGERKFQQMDEDDLKRNILSILTMVREQTGHDFSRYKQNTVRRRIERRMALHKLDDVRDYRLYLRRNISEIDGLFKDLTIHVTRLFRDPEAFEKLRELGLKPLIRNRPADAPFRIWVPGCATGEEAYSLGMLMMEAFDNRELRPGVDFKIFASDIDPEAIEFARQGTFPEGLLADLSKERTNRFFTRNEHEYVVKNSLREAVVFAMHDVTGDPPFSNMDLISCRNLLIYMNNDLQEQVLRIFHYSLKPGGILFLGTSETIGNAESLFTPIDSKNKLYRRRDGEADRIPIFRLPGYRHREERDAQSMREAGQKTTDFQAVRKTQQLVEQTLLEAHASPAVLINEGGEILYFHGDTGRYLSLPSGAPVFHISRLARGELHNRLTEAIEKVKKNREPVRVKPFSIRQNDHFLSLGLSLKPILEENRYRYILVEFLEDRSPETRPKAAADEKGVVTGLRQELRATRHELHATIEELETANEELKSSNEELQANNEELESSKEELQSINEELETVNAQQTRKNEALMTVEDDLNNLFAASEIGTLFLDTELNIKRFNPKAKAIFNVREDRDVGRSIKDITSNLTYDTLARDADEVLDTLVRKEIQVRSMDGASQYLVRIVPYRSRKNVIEGLIITFLDITRYEALRTGLRDFKTFFNNTLSALWEPVLLLNEDLTVFTANDSFYRIFRTSSKETENRPFFDLGEGQWNIPKLRESLERVIPDNEGFEAFEVKRTFPNLGDRKMVLNARRIDPGEKHPAMVMVSFKNPTE